MTLPPLILLCGPAGSGKTTVARTLEARGYRRLSIDEAAWARGLHQAVRPFDLTRDIEDGLLRECARLLAAGQRVVVDNAAHSRGMRERWRAAAPPGVAIETWYVDTPREVVLARIAARTGAGPNDADLPPDVAAAYYDHLERPTPAEGALRIIDGTAPPVLD